MTVMYCTPRINEQVMCCQVCCCSTEATCSATCLDVCAKCSSLLAPSKLYTVLKLAIDSLPKKGGIPCRHKTKRTKPSKLTSNCCKLIGRCALGDICCQDCCFVIVIP